MKNAHKKLRIFLGDPVYFNPFTIPRMTIPLNIGYIASYAQKMYKDECEIRLFKDPARLLSAIRSDPPDVLGLSSYHWSSSLSVVIANKMKGIRSDCLVVIGGPNVDTDSNEQYKLYSSFGAAADMLVVNDGEEGFSNIIGRLLSKGRGRIFDGPIDGCVFFDGKKDRIAGRDIGLSLDLAAVPSPILNGLLDEFMVPDFAPMLHTSRGCPYACAYCAHGKLKERIRVFPEEIVRDEISYIVRKYASYPHKTLIITDDNFGILARDSRISEFLIKNREEKGYPQQIHTYFDKKFTQNVKKTAVLLADMNFGGIQIGLQSLNEPTLRAVNRVIVTEKELDDIIEWSKANGFEMSCDLIYGLPYETKESFYMAIERLIRKRIDQLIVLNLQLIPGIALARDEERRKYGFITKFRPLFSNDFGWIDGVFAAESQEVVAASSSSSFDDYKEARRVMLFVYTIWALGYCKKTFDYLIDSTDIVVMDILRSIIAAVSDRTICLSDEDRADYSKYMSEFIRSVESELYDTPEELTKDLKAKSSGKNLFLEPTRLNVYFGAKLIYSENRWFGRLLSGVLTKMGLDARKKAVVDDLIKISDAEWVDINNPEGGRELAVGKETLTHLNIGNANGRDGIYWIRMSPSLSQSMKIKAYTRQFENDGSEFSYYRLVDNILPRRLLRYEVFSGA